LSAKPAAWQTERQRPSSHPQSGGGGEAITYVYILQCIEEPSRYYVGATEDLRARLKAHNSGRVPHTSKFKRWQVNTYLAFSDRDRAFAKKRL
jgi:predicted GIY-YIG superfamily endonuclease